MLEFQRFWLFGCIQIKKKKKGKEKSKQSVQEYKTKREEKESIQYQNNLIYKTFDSMLHPVVLDQQLI